MKVVKQFGGVEFQNPLALFQLLQCSLCHGDAFQNLSSSKDTKNSARKQQMTCEERKITLYYDVSLSSDMERAADKSAGQEFESLRLTFTKKKNGFYDSSRENS